MYHLGYYEHYLKLRQQYPNFHFDYPRDWSLKEYGTLWIFDTIKSNRAKKVLEVGCGYDTFFAKQMKVLGVDYYYIDKSNDYLGIGKDEERFNNTVEERKNYGATFIDGLLGSHNSKLPDGYFDLVFSISVIEHIDDQAMPNVVDEIKRILLPGGCSAHSIDIYPRSTKAKSWHIYNKQVGFEVPLPYYDRWEFEGKYTTFIENPKVRHLIYNNISNNDPIDKVPYVSHCATQLCRSFKPEFIKQ
jgi:SAM-dependent methyltransferase